MEYTTKLKDISEVRKGDTVIHNGVMKTISGTDIKINTFVGTTLFGDSYNNGYKKVTVVIFPKWVGGERI